jgi:hypothetical protein
MEHDQDFQDRVQAITEIRAKAMEANRAFNAVMRLRGDLAEARNMLAFAISDQRQPIERVNRIQQHIGGIEADLSKVERYCREVNPDRLQRHEDELAQAAEVARKAREQEMAEHDRALEENRQRASVQAAERIRHKVRREAEESDLLARFRGVAQ